MQGCDHRAAHAVDPERGFPYYSGIMDYTGIERVPVDREIEDAKRWLAGEGSVQ